MFRWFRWVYPVKGYYWIELYNGEIILRKVHKEIYDPSYYEMRCRRRLFGDGHTICVWKYAWGKHKLGELVVRYAPYRYWWLPKLPSEEPKYKIEINIRAKKELDERLRTPRTLP
jgi:hypothetical protein